MENVKIPENWAVYIGDIDDKPAVFRVNLGLAEVLPLEGYPEAVRVSIQLKKPDENGFYDEEEREIAYAIDDAIAVAAEAQGAILAGVVTYQGEVAWHCYAANGKALEEAVKAVEGQYPDYPLAVKIAANEAWEVYFDYLYPNIYEMQAIQNDKVRDHAREVGDQVEVPRPIEHYLYFETDKDTQRAADKMRELGYEIIDAGKVEPDEEDDPNADLGYRILASKVSTPVAINADTWDLVDVALDNNGEYDGWETIIVKSV